MPYVIRILQIVFIPSISLLSKLPTVIEQIIINNVNEEIASGQKQVSVNMKRKRKSLFGLSVNEEVVKNQNKYLVEIYFVTLNPIYFLKQRQIYQSYGLQNKILWALLPWHIWKYLSSKILIASHGVYFHSLVVKYLKVTTIFCGHALDGVYPVGGNKESKAIKDLQLFSGK